MNLKDLLDNFSNVSEDLAAVSQLAVHIANHREELVTALRSGAIADARATVRHILVDCPPAAGIVNYLMTSDVDSAINAIGMYDPELCESLRGCRANFAALQQQWPVSEPRAVATGS